MRADSSAMRSPSRSRSGRRLRVGRRCARAFGSGGLARAVRDRHGGHRRRGLLGGGQFRRRRRRRLAWQGDSVGCHASMVHLVFDTPLLAPGRADRPFRGFLVANRRGRPRARAEGENESGTGRVGGVAQSGARDRVNPIRPEISFFCNFFRHLAHSNPHADRTLMDVVAGEPRCGRRMRCPSPNRWGCDETGRDSPAPRPRCWNTSRVSCRLSVRGESTRSRYRL